MTGTADAVIGAISERIGGRRPGRESRGVRGTELRYFERNRDGLTHASSRARPAHRLRQHREPGAQGGQSASEGLGDVLEEEERRGVHSYAVHAQVRQLEHVMRGDMG